MLQIASGSASSKGSVAAFSTEFSSTTAIKGKADAFWRGFSTPWVERLLPPGADIQIDQFALTAIAPVGQERTFVAVVISDPDLRY